MKKLISAILLLFSTVVSASDSSMAVRNFFLDSDGVKIEITQPDGRTYDVYQMEVDGYPYLRAPGGEVLIKDEEGWYVHAMYYEYIRPQLISTGKKYYIADERNFDITPPRISIWRQDIARIAQYEREEIEILQEAFGRPGPSKPKIDFDKEMARILSEEFK